MESIFSLKIEESSGIQQFIDKFKGKVLLIVNTATECGFTPQLKELETLYQSFKDQGLMILGFPSNDFGNQEPRDGEEIEKFCQVNYGVSFPFFIKSRVRGPYANDLFKFFADKKRNGKFSSTPRWNFHKFLIDRKGFLVDFYYPITKPSSKRLRKAILKLL